MDIKRIRDELFLTQEEFARLLGVSRQTVNSWERGLHEIKEENIDKIKVLVKNIKKILKNY